MLRAMDVWKHVRLSLVGDLPSEGIGYREEDFLDHLNHVLIDFLRSTGLCVSMDSVHATAGQASYDAPDSIADIFHVLYDQCFLPQTEALNLDVLARTWRLEESRPQAWAEDSHQPNRFILFPSPLVSGDEIETDQMLGTVGYNTDLFNSPSPFYGVVREIELDSGEIVPTYPFVGTISGITYGRRNILLIGSSMPVCRIGALYDVIPYVPGSFATYLAFGCLSMFFSGAGELKDPLKAAYCTARYNEGVQLAKSMGRESMEVTYGNWNNQVEADLS